MADLDALDQRLLTLVQTSFPLSPRPWADLGAAAGVDEDEVFARVSDLRRRRMLRSVSAIFDSRALGYRSALVAAEAPAGGLDAAAAAVSAHPGVSHNYLREHALNLWFTLAVPADLDLDTEAAALAARAGLLRYHALPALRTFRIGVAFDLEGAGSKARSLEQTPRPQRQTTPQPLTEQDKAAVRVLQEDLPLSPRPFLLLAQSLGWDEEGLFDWMADAGARGLLRRYAGVLRHREVGFGANGMGVWEVAPQDVERLGRAFAQDPRVTHCYQRPVFEGWPYSLFTMVHGRDREDCDAALAALAAAVPGWSSRSVLYSTREFKKERVKYFLEDSPALIRP